MAGGPRGKLFAPTGAHLTSHMETWGSTEDTGAQRNHTERKDAELVSHYKTPGPAFKRILYQPVIETHLIFSALK